ncbi:MAG: TonB-dependent receptor [Rhodocyclaceae bacterium]|nr:TonB-dependent receptor [Rhodocyclaceae bacterium]
MKWYRRQTLALALALSSQAPLAFPLDNKDDELEMFYGDTSFISIATGSQLLLRRAPAVATVVTAADIAATGATDLDEVMETVPGIHVGRSPNIYSSLYMVRGISGPFTPQFLVLENGVPMTTLYMGTKGNSWGGYPVEHIDRIEVIRGPGSALYGADAYSGVVNIVTKGARDIAGTEFGVRGGSFNTWDSWLQHGGKLGEVEVAAFVRAGSSDGFRRTITADAQTANDQRSRTHASLAPGPVNTGWSALDAHLDLAYDNWRFQTGYKLRDDLGTAAGVASALDPVGRGKSERTNADLSWTDPRFTQNWALGFTASHMEYTALVPTSFQLYPPGATFPTGTFPSGIFGTPETWERQTRLSAFASYSGLADHRLRIGAGHDDLNLYRTRARRNFDYAANGLPIPLATITDLSASAPFLFPHRRRNTYLYAQDEWSFAQDWCLTAGVRHDLYSDFGGTTNPRLALVWDARYDLTAKLLYGRAFRAPAFIEAYGVNNPVNWGNPDLKPETIDTLEAAFSWQLRQDTQANLNVFRYDMKDIIRPVPNAVPGTGSTYANTGGQHGQGAEIEVIWNNSRDLHLSAHYAHQRSIDEATGHDAGYAPQHHFYGRIDKLLPGGWLGSAQVNHVADRKRAAGDNRPQVPDYTTLDLTLATRRHKNQWDFTAKVRNLFDADVREPSPAAAQIPNDLPMARRAFYLQAVYRM